MDIATAKAFSSKLQISIDCIVREEYEILLLKEIFESEYGTKLVFKGGTSLRLVYGSSRFSEDLDFTMLEEFEATNFIEFLKKVTNRYEETVSIETAIEKFYTVFAVAKVRENFLDRAFSIKIEISKREKEWVKDRDYKDMVIKSEVSPLTVLARVATLPAILREKKDALNNRKAARDVFDYWYIHQLLKKEVKIDLSGYDKTQVKSELHRLLRRPYWRVVDSWLE